MKANSIFVTLLLMFFVAQVKSQTCTVIDSLPTSAMNGYNSFFHPSGITYDGTGLWVSGSQYGPNRIYKYDLNGIRVDSVSYDPDQQPFEAIQFADGYLYAVPYLIDTVYKIDIATEAIVEKYSIGLVPDAEEIIDFAMRGDTLYFVSGGASISRLKLVMSTGELINLGTGNYNFTGIEFMDGQLYGSSWFPLNMQGFLISPDDLMVNETSGAPDWCVNKSMGLTTDGNYFYQLAWESTYIYIMENDFLDAKVEDKLKLKVYPIPAVSEVIIENAVLNSMYTILNIQGELVSSGNITSDKEIVELSLSPGCYWLQIENDKEKYIQKLVILE